MQQRRYRPGDVLDDYCPRERRITDHAIVAMIDDHIKQTRCVVCDAEHEYKDGKVPPQRRKKPQAALFTQVLDGLTGSQPPARVAAHVQAEVDPDDSLTDDAELQQVTAAQRMAVAGAGSVTASHRSARDRSASPTTASVPPSLDDESSDDVAEVGELADIAGGADGDTDDAAPRDEGPWRRQLIRAALPRPEGQQPAPTRPATEFTIRQPTNARGQNRRRGAGGFAQAGNGNGPMRFGRGAPGQGQGPGQGGRRRRGRGGKKNH